MKKKADVTPLEKLRGEIFVDACMRSTGAKTMAALYRSLQSVVTDASLWHAYKAGRTGPSAMNLGFLEKRYPGITNLWEIGPFDLPLWGVLNNDYDVCDAYLRHFLKSSTLPVGHCLIGKRIKNARLSECFLGLMQITLPPNYWRTPKDYNIQPVVDELYRYRRILLSRPESDVDTSVGATPNTPEMADSPALQELAAFYHEQGICAPWEESEHSEDEIEPRDAPQLKPISVLPFDMAEDDFLKLFEGVPDDDDGIIESYESASPKSLVNAPVAIKHLAGSLAYARINDRSRYMTFSLSDLLVIKPNPYKQLCEKHFHVPASDKRRFGALPKEHYNGRDPRCPLVLRYDTLLAFIAAIFLARRNKKDHLVADFLWDGLSVAIQCQFNQTVHDIVKP